MPYDKPTRLLPPETPRNYAVALDKGNGTLALLWFHFGHRLLLSVGPDLPKPLLLLSLRAQTSEDPVCYFHFGQRPPKTPFATFIFSPTFQNPVCYFHLSPLPKPRLPFI